MKNKLSPQEVADEINYMLSSAEPPGPEVLVWLMSHYAEMFETKCGFVPNFDLNEKGQIILIKPELV